MGGGKRFVYPQWVWSPSGGWWPNPHHWKRNTAIYLVFVAATLSIVWKKSDKLTTVSEIGDKTHYYYSMHSVLLVAFRCAAQVQKSLRFLKTCLRLLNAIMALSAAELTVVENYYVLGHAGSLQLRRASSEERMVSGRYTRTSRRRCISVLLIQRHLGPINTLLPHGILRKVPALLRSVNLAVAYFRSVELATARVL
eukprot:gene26574-32116_t